MPPFQVTPQDPLSQKVLCTFATQHSSKSVLTCVLSESLSPPGGKNFMRVETSLQFESPLNHQPFYPAPGTVLVALWIFSKYSVNEWMKDWEGESKETKGNLVISVNSWFMTKTLHSPKSNYIINGPLYTGRFSPAHKQSVLPPNLKETEREKALSWPTIPMNSSFL